VIEGVMDGENGENENDFTASGKMT